MTMWSLRAAPLLVGCDLTKLDEFTRDLLTNDEVLEVNQDELGQAACRVRKDGELEIWSRPLADGTIAVGLFNRGLEPADLTATWTELKLTGPHSVRDLWQRKNLGSFTESFTAQVPAHGSQFLKIGSAKE
jgi:alpha-galactosidase